MKKFESDALREFRSSPDFVEKPFDKDKTADEKQVRASASSDTNNDPQVRMTFYTRKSFQHEIKKRAMEADMSLSSYILAMVKKGMGV